MGWDSAGREGVRPRVPAPGGSGSEGAWLPLRLVSKAGPADQAWEEGEQPLTLPPWLGWLPYCLKWQKFLTL